MKVTFHRVDDGLPASIGPIDLDSFTPDAAARVRAVLADVAFSDQPSAGTGARLEVVEGDVIRAVSTDDADIADAARRVEDILRDPASRAMAPQQGPSGATVLSEDTTTVLPAPPDDSTVLPGDERDDATTLPAVETDGATVLPPTPVPAERVVEALRAAVSGDALENPARVRSALTAGLGEDAGRARSDVHLVSVAAQEGVAVALKRAGDADDALIAELASELAGARGLQLGAAERAVRIWADALGASPGAAGDLAAGAVPRTWPAPLAVVPAAASAPAAAAPAVETVLPGDEAVARPLRAEPATAASPFVQVDAGPAPAADDLQDHASAVGPGTDPPAVLAANGDEAGPADAAATPAPGGGDAGGTVLPPAAARTLGELPATPDRLRRKVEAALGREIDAAVQAQQMGKGPRHPMSLIVALAVMLIALPLAASLAGATLLFAASVYLLVFRLLAKPCWIVVEGGTITAWPARGAGEGQPLARSTRGEATMGGSLFTWIQLEERRFFVAYAQRKKLIALS